ncbi:MAG: DUF5670 family protein [Bacteroidota bacterium]
MKRLIITISIALLVFWVLGFFVLQYSSFIHAALILSAILFLKYAIMCPEKRLEASRTE